MKTPRQLKKKITVSEVCAFEAGQKDRYLEIVEQIKKFKIDYGRGAVEGGAEKMRDDILKYLKDLYEEKT
jgi:hypothetical protein